MNRKRECQDHVVLSKKRDDKLTTTETTSEEDRNKEEIEGMVQNKKEDNIVGIDDNF